MTAPVLTPAGIRTDIVSRLTGATGAGASVYDSRRVGLGVSEIPVITVYSLGHTDSRRGLSGLSYDRAERVGITAVVTADDDPALALALDTIEGQILAALLLDTEWTAVVVVDTIGSSPTMEIDRNRRIGYLELELSISYRPSYEVDLSYDFETLAVTTESTDPDGADVSERELPVGE